MAYYGWLTVNSSLRPSLVHSLDNVSLRNVFYFYRPPFLDEYKCEAIQLLEVEKWRSGHWWHNLAHVCRRWRNIILGSASHLDVYLFCTNGMPVADILEHSPPLPLVIDYSDNCGDFTAEDEERTILALKQRNRVHRVRLRMNVATLRKLTVAICGVYPILEYLVIIHHSEENSAALMLSEPLLAPRLRHLAVGGIAPPQVLTTTMGLVTLSLIMSNPSTYIYPNTLLQHLSCMPWLETLKIMFLTVDPNHDVEGLQLLHTPITTSVTLPNLRRIRYRGLSTYLEAILCQITTPRLEKLYSTFFGEPMTSVPSLPRFIEATKNLRFNNAEITFTSKQVRVALFFGKRHRKSRNVIRTHALSLNADCEHLDVQVSFAVRISNLLSQTFSSVEHLAFEHEEHIQSSEEHNEVDLTEWRKLLISFRNAKILRIDRGLVKPLSRILNSEGGGLPFELLPKLQSLKYSGIGDSNDEMSSFIGARRNAGRPVSLFYNGAKSLRPPKPSKNGG